MNQFKGLIDIGEWKTDTSPSIKKNKRTLNILRFFRLAYILISSIMLVTIYFISYGECAVINSNIDQSTSLDSVRLMYNSVDATTFPRIVSLVTVMNNAGFIIGRLDENNFIVFEDSVREFPIEVIELPSVNIGINVVLTIDRSTSMDGQPIEDAKAAATKFIELMQSNDQSAIVSFAQSPRTDYSFSSNKDSLKAAISRITTNLRTAIFDALMHSVYLMSNELKNRAIILLTDGADNSSSYTYQEALTACLSHEIRVFTIGLGLNRNSTEENVLKNLANATGGLYYFSPTSNELEDIYRAISKILHHRYQISYTTHNPAKDGTLRHVLIDVFVNNNTSSDTASYRAPDEPDPVDPVDPVDLVDPDPVEPEDPVFEVLPNPFTPNDDGFNDWTEFRKGDEIPQDWNISIMDRTGRLVRYLTNGERIWDGKDKSSELMLPGCYLYIITNGKRIIHRGLIQLIR